jgi:hypothetical protein
MLKIGKSQRVIPGFPRVDEPLVLERSLTCNLKGNKMGYVFCVLHFSLWFIVLPVGCLKVECQKWEILKVDGPLSPKPNITARWALPFLASHAKLDITMCQNIWFWLWRKIPFFAIRNSQCPVLSQNTERSGRMSSELDQKPSRFSLPQCLRGANRNSVFHIFSTHCSSIYFSGF